MIFIKQYDITGMSCAACVSRVEKAVKKLPGVDDCSVNLLTNSMTVMGRADAENVISAVKKAGYGASLKGGKNEKNSLKTTDIKDTEIKGLFVRLLSSLVFLIALMYISMGHMVGLPLPKSLSGNLMALGIIQLLLTVAVMVINQKFFISGFKSLFHLSPNMDTLIAIGSFAAFGYSTFSVLAMIFAKTSDLLAEHYHNLYFESAAMILTLITLGKMLEAKSKGKTTNAIKSLIALSPDTATVVRGEGEITVPVAEVNLDDVFIVKPGEKIPVDGIVLEGTTAVDESALTGESIPVDKEIGSKVSAGTVNTFGFIKCKATEIGEDTSLSKIIKLVSDAAASKAPISKAADKVAGIFVPAVITIAIITTLIWIILDYSFGFALARGISVLVISCPCALGLATPVAIMVGSGVGAKNGILFKTAISLEQTGRVKTVVLDKTGTVTEGVPAVTDILPLNGVSEEELLSFAFSLEKMSEHPLSVAVVSFCRDKNIQPFSLTDFKSLTGKGLSAVYNGETLVGGNLKFVKTVTNLSDEIEKKAYSLSGAGKTPLFFALGNKLLGIIAVADVIRKDSKKAIMELRSMGLKTVMLTGDNSLTAKAVGEKVGIERVIAGVLPEEKEKVIRQLKTSGKVIMVGDGINDAPALATADVGIAIGTGTDVAIDSADVVLMKNGLSGLVAAINLSRYTLKNIYENLFWAFVYNTLGIPLAAGVFISVLGWELNPMFGAAAMSLSSFCVVTNALRLNFKNIYRSKIKNIKNNNIIVEEKEKMTVTMKIEGMMCPRCEAHVKSALEKIPGVEIATPNHTTNSAEVVLTEEVEFNVLKSAVENEGYTVLE